jgi:hypothetical protein
MYRDNLTRLLQDLSSLVTRTFVSLEAGVLLEVLSLDLSCIVFYFHLSLILHSSQQCSQCYTTVPGMAGSHGNSGIWDPDGKHVLKLHSQRSRGAS